MTDELETIWKEAVIDPGEAHEIHKTPGKDPKTELSEYKLEL
jgi:hypothetical protein